MTESRLQETELRIEDFSVTVKPMHPGRHRVRLLQPGYTLEVPFYDAERIGRALIEHAEECRKAQRQAMC